MANKQISKLSREELDKGLAEFNTPTQSQISSTQETSNQTYIDKLKDNDIINYFTPYGLIGFEKIQLSPNEAFKALQVNCHNFTVLLSDFDIVVNLHPIDFNFNENNSIFNIYKFIEYCNAIDTAPEKALADLIQLELLGQRFHSYEKRYSKQKQDERKTAFEKLPKNMRKILKPIDEKRENEINATRNKLQYGDFAGESQIKN